MWGTYQIQTKQHMAKITGIHYVNDSVEQKNGTATEKQPIKTASKPLSKSNVWAKSFFLL